MLLSILIATIPKRKALFNALCNELSSQAKGRPVEILYDDGDGSIGHKRQNLLNQATGEYIAFVDDDDLLSCNYISEILAALSTHPDCIGMQGTMTTDGKALMHWVISKDIQEWSTKGNTYLRHTNHLTPVKRSIALQVGFNDSSYGEDYDYSMRLRGKLNSEVRIEKDLYHYRFNSKK